MYRKYRIEVLSPLGTHLQGDTLFGHLCWGIRYLKGEKMLEEFLEQYEEKDVPLLVSDAFPKDHLPRPCLPPPSHQELEQLAHERAKDKGPGHVKGEDTYSFISAFQDIKKTKKEKFIHIHQWKDLRKNASEEKVIKSFLSNMDKQEKNNVNKEDKIPGLKAIPRAHNTIDRIKGRVLETGGFYFTDDKWVRPDDEFRYLDIYLWFRDEEVISLWEEVWTEYIEKTGYGMDKSAGKGMLRLNTTKQDMSLFEMEAHNALMSLSPVAFMTWPEGMDAWYKLRVKYGRLGGHFAVSGIGKGTPNPFKKPIAMMEPGSIFLVDKINLKGQLLKNVHVDSRIRHYGLPLTIPIRVDKECLK